jgi:hypothetical protein
MKAKLVGIAAVISLLALGLVMCTLRVQDTAKGEIAICTVQAVPSGRLVLRGNSTLPEGTCLHTQLFVDGKGQPWWPTFARARVRGGTWQMVVPLGKGGAPDELDRALPYTLTAWKQGDPSVQSVFHFDLTGRPAGSP